MPKFLPRAKASALRAAARWARAMERAWARHGQSEAAPRVAARGQRGSPNGALSDALRREWAAALGEGVASAKAFTQKHGRVWLDEPDGAAGRTPLMAAAERGDARLWAFLIESGADPQKTCDGGVSPLMVAVACGHPPLIELALDAGVDPLLADHRQNSALTIAVLQQGTGESQRLGERLARRLVDASDIEACDWRGRSALHLAAASGGQPEIVAALAEKISPLKSSPERSEDGGYSLRRIPSPAQIALERKNWAVLDAMLLCGLVSAKEHAKWTAKAPAGALPRCEALALRDELRRQTGAWPNSGRAAARDERAGSGNGRGGARRL